EREHRRYFRHPVDLPIELQLYTDSPSGPRCGISAREGFAIRTSETLPEGVLSVQFDLPSIDPETIRGRAVVVWASASVAGLRFLYLEPQCRAGFQAWLDSMEAQLRFRESAHESRMCSQNS